MLVWTVLACTRRAKVVASCAVSATRVKLPFSPNKCEVFLDQSTQSAIAGKALSPLSPSLSSHFLSMISRHPRYKLKYTTLVPAIPKLTTFTSIPQL